MNSFKTPTRVTTNGNVNNTQVVMKPVNHINELYKQRLAAKFSLVSFVFLLY